VEDQLRLRRSDCPIQALTTKLNVFTTKVGSSTEFQVPASRNSRDECVTCQLWDITNPGGNLKCDECSSKVSVAPEIFDRFDGEPKATTATPQLEFLSTPLPKRESKREGTGRCSACEISALIEPIHFVTCASCTPNLNLSSTTSPPQPSKVKRCSARRPPTKLESHALRYLQNWLRENRSNPYPDADTKRLLAEQCGITEKQVNTWFTNARARRRLVNPADQSNPASEDEGSRNSRLTSVTSMPIFDYSTSSSFATTFDRQCADESHPSGNSFDQSRAINCRRGKKKNYGQTSLLSPATLQASPMLPAPLPEPTANTDNEPVTWQCTFCFQQVAPKSWRRHEETQHRPKRKWTCLHTGPTLTLSSQSNTSSICVFCQLPNPGDEHLQRSHRITECAEKSEEDRTFLRPDHLRQHVKNFHKSLLEDVVRDTWRRDGPRKNVIENWTCGFCAKELETWDVRETHIAGHFKDGLTMADWKGYVVQVGEKSRKRPMSSEGRPGVFAKLARTFTGRSTRQEHRQESLVQFANAFESMDTVMDAEMPFAPLLPDLVFDSFMAEVCGDAFDYNCNGSNGVRLEEQQDALDAGCNSAFPEDESLGADFDALTGVFLHEDVADLTGLWYQ
jgi:hypothetical protein